MTNNRKNDLLIRLLNDSRCQFLFFSIMVYCICVFEYKYFVVERFEYMGYPDKFSLIKSFFAFVLYVVSHGLLFVRSLKFVRGFTALFILVFLMPILVLFQYADSGGELYVIFSFFLLLIINSNFSIKLPKTTTLKLQDRPLAMLILAVLLFVPFLLVYKINLDPQLFLFGKKIYEVRAGLDDTGNLYTGYVLSPLFQFILPVLAIYGLSSKKIYLTFIAIFITTVMYLMIPQKSIFLGIFVVSFFYFFKEPIRKVAVFSGIVLIILMIGILLSNFSDSIILESLLLRRYFIVPAFLNHVYFDFFQDENLLYSYSFLKGYFHYPYELLPSYRIGQDFFNGKVLNANNGFLSDAYINFGAIGMFVNTVIVAGLIKFFDSLSIDSKFFGIFFLLLNLLRSSALPTMILTHGIWLLVIMAFYLLRKTELRPELT